MILWLCNLCKCLKQYSQILQFVIVNVTILFNFSYEADSYINVIIQKSYMWKCENENREKIYLYYFWILLSWNFLNH